MESLSKQLKFLKSFRSKLDLRTPPVSKGTLAKLKALRKIKLSNQNVGLSESNFHGTDYNVCYNGLNLAYGYQRINLNPAPDSNTHPYFGLKPKLLQDGSFFLFTSSGQSAISVSLLCLREIFGNQVRLQDPDVYYETYEYFKKFKFRLSNSPNTKHIFFVDSSTIRDRDDGLKINRHTQALVVDTTCWSLGDRSLNRLVEKAFSVGACVLFLRSHIKLDCLGTEMNRLGSLLLMMPPKKPSVIRKFRELNNQYGNFFGFRAEIPQIYPFLFSKKFHQLNEKWVGDIRKSNRRLAKEMEKINLPLKCRWKSFDHSLFGWLILHDLNFEELEQFAGKLKDGLNSSGIDALKIASYPWDFVSLTTFEAIDQNSTSKKKVSTLRISVPSLTSTEIKRVIEVVKRLLQRELQVD